MKKNKGKNSRLVRKHVNILGTSVISTDLKEVLAGVNDFLTYNSVSGNRKRKFSIVTPNPELVLASVENRLLRKALNSAEFAVPDGIGLAQAAKFLSLPAPKNIVLRGATTFCQGVLVGMATLFYKKWLTDELNIVKGRELFAGLIELAEKKRWRVFMLGGKDNEADMAAKKLRYRHSKLKVMWANGPKVNANGEPVAEIDKKLQKDVIDRINAFAPQILFVAFGNPKQEVWIQRNLVRLNVGAAMAVGGTFRYIAGLSKLPPKFMEDVGLEWLWRVLTEPVRLRRIWNAVVVFPWKVFISKLAVI